MKPALLGIHTEAHPLGTALGDLIEAQAINEVFKKSHTVERPLFLTASKTCVGHAEIAAGLVGVLAALASISHVSVPGLTHLTTDNINPAIDCSAIPMHIPWETVSLQQRKENTDNPLRVLVLWAALSFLLNKRELNFLFTGQMDSQGPMQASSLRALNLAAPLNPLA